MSIRDVTELVGGRLQFGPMPPLDGILETIGRILPTCQNVKPRDVVLPWQNQQSTDCFLEEAYARGALGVIAERLVTPWAGRFSLTVDDTSYVLQRLACWRAGQLRGHRVMVVDPLTPSPTYHFLCQMLQQTTSEMEYAMEHESEGSMLWQIIGLDPDRENTLVHVTEIPTSSNWHESYAPDVLVLCVESALPADRSTEECFTLVAPRLTADMHVVMPVDMVNEACQIGWRGPITSYGCTNQCDVIGEQTTDNELLAINGIAMTPGNSWRYAERSVLAAVAAARVLEIPEFEIIKRIEGQTRGDDRRHVAS